MLGGTVDLHAPSVSLGNRNRDAQIEVAPRYSGAGSFNVSGSFIELVGSSSVSGVASTTLDSGTDIRLTGVQLASGRTVTGAFRVPGELTLQAEQVYPSSFSDFELRAINGGADSVISIENRGDATPLLSAGGGLTLVADTIEQNGRLRAPFGEIRLVGQSVSLGADSLTSTSADGVMIPFGSTEGGADWVLTLADQQTILFDRPPAQQIAIDARDIVLAPGSTLDLSGGGDLVAYEFIPGVGGSRDVLSAAASPDTFAIVPGLDLKVAPFDPVRVSWHGPRHWR